MNLFLDVISPIPEFTVINNNKIILSRRIVKSEENKLSDSIIPVYKKIDKALNLTRNLTSLIVTKGPGSYTSLRIGISFILGTLYDSLRFLMDATKISILFICLYLVIISP